MATNGPFRGAGVALVTPFKDDGSLDDGSLEKLVEWQIEEGTNFLVPCGTTGENPSLTPEEHFRVVEITVKTADGRVPVLAGAGSNSTRMAIDLAIGSLDQGADGILTVAPYYNKPTPDGMLRHFRAQADAIDNLSPGKPMIIYNVPGRTGCNISAETLRRLADEIPNVVGVKEASGNMDQISSIIRQRDRGFVVLSGDDALAVPMIAIGADGVISVAANEVPRQMTEMVASALHGDFDMARSTHLRLLPLLTGNFIESNPGPVKAAMEMMGIIPNDRVRSPLAPVTESTRQRLNEILVECGLLDAKSG